jgi:hypothetical protein
MSIDSRDARLRTLAEQLILSDEGWTVPLQTEWQWERDWAQHVLRTLDRLAPNGLRFLFSSLTRREDGDVVAEAEIAAFTKTRVAHVKAIHASMQRRIDSWTRARSDLTEVRTREELSERIRVELRYEGSEPLVVHCTSEQLEAALPALLTDVRS